MIYFGFQLHQPESLFELTWCWWLNYKKIGVL